MTEEYMNELLNYDDSMFKAIVKKMSLDELQELEEYFMKIVESRGITDENDKE